MTRNRYISYRDCLGIDRIDRRLYAALALSYSAVTGDTITAARWNTMGTEITASVNSISNAQIASDAAIAYSKLNLTGNLVNADISGSAAIAYSKLNLTGAILNADLAGSIAASKISNTAATLAGAQTFTGAKTFAQTIQTITTASDGATVTFDLSLGNIHTVTLGGNRTLALSGGAVGQCFILRLVQDGTGSRTVTWFSTIKWAGGSAPTLTTTASKTDVLGFITTSSGNYDAFIVGQNL